MQSTDVFVGGHGASLTNVLYLPPWAALVELGHPARGRDMHFQRMAHLVGVAYRRIQLGSENPRPQLLDKVVAMVVQEAEDIPERRWKYAGGS